MRLGLLLYGSPPLEWPALARRAEACGFDTVCIGEHQPLIEARLARFADVAANQTSR